MLGKIEGATNGAGEGRANRRGLVADQQPARQPAPAEFGQRGGAELASDPASPIGRIDEAADLDIAPPDHADEADGLPIGVVEYLLHFVAVRRIGGSRCNASAVAS